MLSEPRYTLYIRPHSEISGQCIADRMQVSAMRQMPPQWHAVVHQRMLDATRLGSRPEPLPVRVASLRPQARKREIGATYGISMKALHERVGMEGAAVIPVVRTHTQSGAGILGSPASN